MLSCLRSFASLPGVVALSRDCFAFDNLSRKADKNLSLHLPPRSHFCTVTIVGIELFIGRYPENETWRG